MHMQVTAYGLLIYSITKSAFLLGLATAISAIPDLMSLPGGFVADRMGKKKMLQIAQIITGVNALILAVLLWIGIVEYLYIVILSFTYSVALRFVLPARLAFIPEIVKKDEFMNAYSLFYVAMNIMRILGPILAGILTYSIGIAGVYFLIGTCHLLFVIPLHTTKIIETKSNTKSSMKADLFALLTFSRRNTTILTLMVLGSGLTLLAQSTNILNPVFAEDLGVGAIGLGLLNSATGVGALIGSIVSASISHYKRKSMFLLISGILRGLGLFLFANSTTFYLSMIFMGIGGVTEGIHTTARSALFQLCATDEMRGRVMSLYFITSEFRPVGTLLIGAVAQNSSARFAVGTFGLVWMIFCTTIGIVYPKFRRLRL